MSDLRLRQVEHGAEVTWLNSRGVNWKAHIYEEHNFRKMLFFIIYLLVKPANQCSGWENGLKQKIIAGDISFFDDLRIDRKENRLGWVIDGTFQTSHD